MLIKAEATGIRYFAETPEDRNSGYGSCYPEEYNSCLGQQLQAISVDDNKLVLEFPTCLLLVNDENHDAGCDTTRYMTTDEEDIGYYIGALFFGLELKPVDPRNSTNLAYDEDGNRYGQHDISFLDVHTSRGVFSLACHNEHNGYYGGFDLQVKRENLRLPLGQLLSDKHEAEMRAIADALHDPKDSA